MENERKRECKRGGDTERERLIKRTTDCKRGGGIGSEGKKMEGRDVIDG